MKTIEIKGKNLRWGAFYKGEVHCIKEGKQTQFEFNGS